MVNLFEIILIYVIFSFILMLLSVREFFFIIIIFKCIIKIKYEYSSFTLFTFGTYALINLLVVFIYHIHLPYSSNIL